MNPTALIGALLIAAPAQPGAMPKQVASLVAAERAFAKMAETSSMRDAFLANLADGAIVFNPGPTDGRALHESRPASDVLLAWEPAYAEIAASGDFGFTTGPWEYSRDRSSAPVAFGHFVSVWKKQADGAWKVALDVGVSHDPPDEKPALSFRVSDNPLPWPLDNAGRAAARTALLETDGAFAGAFARSAAGAIQQYGAPDVRRYRDGAAPVSGRDAVMAAAGTGGGGSVMRATGADIASSADLGYTMGFRGEPVAAWYVRIWRLDEKANWKVVLDLESAVDTGE